ncbi:bifunctional protein-disulfide isomerase/oxidoreductase DsbC [Alteromonas sp. KUL49]|uniref:bifunctional protein-disulfide isomerase/oxidoreductase DsbC n=1 Tax=Alteromonas sp. KUL49 TaxID=2480798 RepID=UPI00102EE162|nr:bifunctional protein-disulfide isomerase/oxidoreductase DsbC [Alteromonas sp. KUL49]GEA12335.1 thiol:disulfide interchange protein DsbC [Alteromonas sp. KUL49]
MKFTGYLLFALAVNILVGFSASAQEDTENADAAIKMKLEALLGMEVESVSSSPISGLREVFTSRGLFYVSNDSKYFVQARVFNLDEGMRNETDAALAGKRKDGVMEFAPSSIEFKADDEKYVVSVYTDITCGYCRKFHDEIDDLNHMGITVRYLAFPRAGLNSQNYTDMVSVWCAEEPTEALTDAKAGERVTAAQCENQVAEHYRFGQQVGVQGTPYIILDNGTLIPGYKPAADLLQILQNAS